MRPIDADAVCERCKASGAICTGKDCEIPTMPALTPQNDPLTIEQLREMDGEPVWLDVAGGMWTLVDALDGCLWLDRGGSIDIAKFAGKAYRRPPEGEEDTQ